jgi:acetyl-CoA synthetase
MAKAARTEVGAGRPLTVERGPRRVPLIGDYQERRRTFTWNGARRWLDGLPDGCLNIAHEAVDRHASSDLADHVALRFLDRTLPTQDLTYAELRDLTNAFAIALRTFGVRPGERVCTLLDRSPALYVTARARSRTEASTARCFPPSAPNLFGSGWSWVRCACW